MPGMRSQGNAGMKSGELFQKDVLDALDVLHNNFIVNFIVCYLNMVLISSIKMDVFLYLCFLSPNKVGVSFLILFQNISFFLRFELL